MEKGTNAGGTGEHNRRVILRALRLNGPLSRAEIARGTGLVPQTVSNIMLDLAADGLVLPAESIRGRRGQPAVPFRIAPNGAFALGLQIDQYGARGVALNQLGKVVATTETQFAPAALERNLDRVLMAVAGLRDELRALAEGREPRIVGLGLAMPAPTGVHGLNSDPWMRAPRANHPIVAAMEEATGLPVSLHHDGAAAAVAERLDGVARGVGNFVLVFVGYGLGAGIHVHGALHDGHHSLAGELGQIPVPVPDGMIPLEQVASLAPLYARLRLRPDEAFAFSRVEAALRAHPDEMEGWLASAGPRFAWLVDVLTCVLDPDCIVIAGQMPKPLLSALFDRVTGTCAQHPPLGGISRPRLLAGSGDVFSVAMGAAAYPISRAFDPSLSAIVKATGGGAEAEALPAL